MTDTPNTTDDPIRSAVLAERERIAKALEDEADVTPCEEDANVTRELALLVMADFSYDRLDELKEARHAR
jgi:hypothetical protein